VLFEIGRNRKFLLENFEFHSKSSRLTYDVTKKIIEDMLKNSGVYVQDDSWQMLIKFAEKEGEVDYKFFLEIYKDRNKRIDSHPIRSLPRYLVE
jgi:Ca2+-binding EF-hand superfamily protein